MLSNIKKKIGTGLIKVGWALSSPYEGHKPSRRYEPLPRMIGRQDDFSERGSDRVQLMSTARALCNLFGLPNRILRTYANYVIGDCQVFWATSDETWNDAAEEWWRQQSLLIDVTGRFDFASLMRLALISQIRDGDIGFIKVRSPNRLSGYVSVEPVEADRIVGPGNINYDPVRSIYGGVELDRDTGRPVAYWVAKRGTNGQLVEHQRIPADSFILFYDTTRFDACRGITAFANGALLRSRTLREIIRCEETGVLTANKWSVVIKASNSDKIMPIDYLMDNAEETASDTKGELPPIENIYDGTIFHLEPGEDVTLLKSDRPSPAWQGFVEYLIKDIAISLDLPYEFVWDMSRLTGPGVRMIAKQAERTFRNVWRNLEWRLMRPLINWAITNAMNDGVLDWNEEFYRFMIQRPELPTIDAGRESQSNLNEWRSGLLTGAEICKERGVDVYSVIEQRAREIAYANEVARKYGVDPSMLYELAKNSQAKEERE